MKELLEVCLTSAMFYFHGRSFQPGISEELLEDHILMQVRILKERLDERCLGTVIEVGPFMKLAFDLMIEIDKERILYSQEAKNN